MEEAIYRQILEEMGEGVYFVDLDRQISYWNRGAERITGYPAGEVVGHSCGEGILRHVSESGRQLCLTGCPLQAAMADGTARTANVYLHHKEGHRIPVTVRGRAIRDAAGRIVGSVELFRVRATTRFADSAEGDRAEDAYSDHLTGIGNRRFGELNLAAVIATVDAGLTSLGVLFVDVDHFKSVNDTHGHGIGDRVLRMVAQDLAHGLRAGDFPIRWGGEEFVALLPGIDAGGLAVVAERVRMLVENSWIQHHGSQIRVTVSVGAALAEPGEGAAALLDRADRLMYAAKAAGRNLVATNDGLQPRGGELPIAGTGRPWEMADLDVRRPDAEASVDTTAE